MPRGNLVLLGDVARLNPVARKVVATTEGVVRDAHRSKVAQASLAQPSSTNRMKSRASEWNS
jgi:hypothetical protein